MSYNPIGLLRYGKKGLAYCEKVAKDKYKVCANELYGLPETLTKQELKDITKRYGFRFLVEYRKDKVKHCVDAVDL